MSTNFLFTCTCGNCIIRIRKERSLLDPANDRWHESNTRQRAGAFVYTSEDTPRVLIVQSYDWKWGPPKGCVESGERAIECAKREVVEETGIDLCSTICSASCKNVNKWTLYRVCVNKPIKSLPKCSEITGIGWVTVECILRNAKIMNFACKLSLQKFMNVHI